MMNAVIVKDLTKYYGAFRALNNISFTISSGEIFGLIGPNGAGKTTTLRIIATLLKPTYGKVSIFGYDLIRDKAKIKRIIGYLPEEAGIYRRLTGYEYLKFFANIYASERDDVDKIMENGLEICGLGERIYDRLENYSSGMIRRVVLARVLMTKPKLAILDEPTVGLDVYASITIRNIIKRYAKKYGMTVILSSHNMFEIEYLCDRIAYIHQGNIISIGSPIELKRRFDAKNLEEAFIKAIGGEYLS